MPIIGLSDLPAQLGYIGHLRKGAPKPTSGAAPGKDLTYLRFDSERPELEKLFLKLYGPEPRTIENVFVPYAHPDANFEAWREVWTSSTLMHRCDGVTVHQWFDVSTGKHSFVQKPCEISHLTGQQGGCTRQGRLKLIIPALGEIGLVTLHTSSIWDIINVSRQLRSLYNLASNVGGTLVGVPLTIMRIPSKIAVPMNGERRRVEKYMLAIGASIDYVQRALAAQQRNALPPAADDDILMLPAYLGDDDDDDGDAAPVQRALPPAPTSAPTSAPARSAAPAPPRQTSPTTAIAAGSNDAETRVNEFLRSYCVGLKGSEKTGEAYFKGFYGKKSFAERQQAVLDLNLDPAADVQPVDEVEAIDAELISDTDIHGLL